MSRAALAVAGLLPEILLTEGQMQKLAYPSSRRRDVQPRRLDDG